MRPAGEIRQALFKAMQAGPATARVLAARACVGHVAATNTLNNMVRAGHAAKLKPTRVPGVNRPVPVYAEPAGEGARPDPAAFWQQLTLHLFEGHRA